MLSPRMHRAWLLAFLSCSACAREILPLEGFSTGEEDADVATPEDAGMTPEDATSTPRDAELGTPDAAACPDGDKDGVCDAKDNCPTVRNADQTDSNKDGVGDACTMAACTLEAVPASVRAGDATFSQVSVNGNGGTATVRPGASVTVSLHFEFDECSIVETAQMRFVVNGVDGQGASCARQTAFTCPLPGASTTSFNVNAPSTPGPHYIVAKGVQGYTCSESLSGAQRIAAICVQP